MPGRFVSGLVIVVMAAGCQSSGPPQPEAGTAAISSIYGEARVRESLTTYSEAIAEHCSVAGGGSIGCFQRTLLTSFAAESAAAGRACTLDMEFDPFFDCVLYGSTAERILNNLGDRAVDRMDWADPRGSFDAAIDLAAVRVQEKCPLEQRSCVGPETARILGLAATVGDRCVADGGPSLGGCLAGALLIEQFETATRNVGTVAS